MASPSPNTSPLRSEYADDPDMAELVDLFVSELSDRIARLESGLAQSRLSDLKTLAHQLKGAAGGYGYPELSRVAGLLETQLIQDDALRGTAALARSVQDLVSICRRAIDGHTPSN